MILKMFAIYDSKAEAFIQPFFFPKAGLAIRSFASAANNADSDFNKHAGDYTLFEIGSVDQDTGKVTSLDAPKNLGTALTFITNE